MADDIRSMPARLRKVDGGYELFIPDEYATAVGIAPGVAAELDLMGDMLWVRQHEHIERMRAERYATFDRARLHDPHEPYEPAPDIGQVSR